jgi:hypothetical protein
MRFDASDGRASPEVRIGWPNRISMLMYLAGVGLTRFAAIARS